MRLVGPYGRRVPYAAILGLYWGATWTLFVASFGAALLANGLDRARRAFAVRVAVVGLLAGAGLVATVAVVAAGVLAGVHGGWVFAAPILTVAGVLVGPAIAAALLTPPTLVRLAHTVAPAERPAVAAAPRLVTPLHALAAAAVVALHRALVVVAQPPYIGALAAGLAVVAVAAVLSAASQRATAADRLNGHPTTGARVARWAIVILAGVAPAVGLTVRAASESCLPDSYAHGAHAEASGSVPHRSGAELTGPVDEPADRAVTLTAQTATVTLDDGTTVDAWTFDGTVPGPALRVTAGELLEVTLANRDVPDGVTIHWHGLEVPNAEDGVAGVTQDAVHPGESHVYRFRLTRAGTFWYHSHQYSSVQVARGLYGVLVVEPSDVDRGAIDRETVDLAVAVHRWPRAYELRLDWAFLGFNDCSLRVSTRINGRLHPDTPVLTVRGGDLVRVTIINRSPDDHPMHLHGHTALVLAATASRPSAAHGGPTP